MDTNLRNVVEEELQRESNYITTQHSEDCSDSRFVFTNCRNIKPKEISIQTNPRSPDWQIGFFDADGEVYFDKIQIQHSVDFSNIVRSYWWNGKEGGDKREGYYSLIKQVQKLEIKEEHVSDLFDYVEGRYETGVHWRLYELDRNIELIIDSKMEETALERLQKHFDNIWCDEIITDLKTKNNITYNCGQYLFRNCEGVMPQKLIINATVEHICFNDAVNEVYIPKIMMEEKADLKSIIQNKYGDNEHYSLLPFAQTLIIRKNLKVLYDLADYINGRYKIDDGWQLYELNKNMKIVIEKLGIAFGAVKEISDYFADVLVDDNKPEQYLAKQQPYQKSFQEHFNMYDLETGQIENIIPASQELRLESEKFNVGGSSRIINELHVNQKIEEKQFVCFHDTDKPVVINEILIDDGGDLRCVLQNAYYNGMDSGFFSLLQTAKKLIILNHQNKNYRNKNNQVIADFADYIDGKYPLNTNWKQEELDRDMKIIINSDEYSLSLNVAQRLRKYFKSVSINRIYTPLETENVIDQECEDKYIFVDSRQQNPQKFVINAKLMGSGILILFNSADNEVHVPEITIDEQGCFATIVRNWWQNNKVGNEYKYGYYSLVQYVKTLTIKNNLGVLKDLADYVVRKYEIGHFGWKLQQLSRDIKIVVEGLGDAFLHVFRISKYFQFVTVDGKQANDYVQIIEQEELKNPDYKAFSTCFEAHDLRIYPFLCSIEIQNELELMDYAYNIRKSVDSIDSVTVRQKLDINQFVCFHDIDKLVTINEIVIEDFGDLRSVLQNAYYSNGQGGFFSLLKTVKRLEIGNNEQAVEDLADYVDDKYSLHPKWETQALDRNMEIKIKIMNSPGVAKRLRGYFRNVSIDCIKTPLETENVIDQECEVKYVFSSCRDANPQKLAVNANLAGTWRLILFNDADGEVCIPEIMIGEHGSFSAVVCNHWQNYRNDNKRKEGYYSLVSHVKALTIQNNPEAVHDLDKYVSGNYKIQDNGWKVQKLSKNTIVRINGVKGLDEQINRLKNYFGYIVIDSRKVLGNQHRESITNIKLDCDKIHQRNIANTDKRNAIARADAEIAETRRRIERARARLGRRRARFQEYLALVE